MRDPLAQEAESVWGLMQTLLEGADTYNPWTLDKPLGRFHNCAERCRAAGLVEWAKKLDDAIAELSGRARPRKPGETAPPPMPEQYQQAVREVQDRIDQQFKLLKSLGDKFSGDYSDRRRTIMATIRKMLDDLPLPPRSGSSG